MKSPMRSPPLFLLVLCAALAAGIPANAARRVFSYDSANRRVDVGFRGLIDSSYTLTLHGGATKTAV